MDVQIQFWQRFGRSAILLTMINLHDILKAANGQFFGEPATTLFTQFAFDPHEVQEGDLFVALQSDQGDTHQYIEQAIQNGALGVLCAAPPAADTDGVTVLIVRDTIDALLVWSQYTLSKLDVKTIAVAGSSGKSATADAIAHVLRTQYNVQVGSLDVDGILSVPLALANLTSQHDYAIIRVSALHPGDIEKMIGALQPRISVINHIDCVHPAAFDSCDQYTEEQSLLARYMSPGSLVVLNYDDENVRKIEAVAREHVIVTTIGATEFGADWLAYNVQVGSERIGFDLRKGRDRYIGRWSPILGRHQLYSLLAAVAVGTYCEIPTEEALNALTTLNALPGRMAPLPGREGLVLVDDTFRASHASTIAAFDWLASVRDESNRTIAIVGDLDDIGLNTSSAHRSVGQHAADIVDILITQGVNASRAARAAVDYGKAPRDVYTTYSTDDAITILEHLQLGKNDVVLVKGGRNSRMEKVAASLLAKPSDQALLVRQDTASAKNAVRVSFVPSWVEIDASAIANNVRRIKERVGENVSMMAVVKADAYGHGAVLASQVALANGATYLAVASIAEAMALRDAGVNAPILVLSYAPVQSVRQAIQQNITLSIYDLEQAQLYDRVARSSPKDLKVHVKLDTGMGRLGFFAEDVVKAFRNLRVMTNLEVEGIFTHFSSAGEDDPYTALQIRLFEDAIAPLRAAGFGFKFVHASNSSGLFSPHKPFFNVVRPGVILYGLQPEGSEMPVGMRPAMTWKTTILQVKDFPPNYPIGYSRTYYTKGDEKIAMLPVGYADGFRRAPRTWQYVLVRGQRAPLVGRVSMEKSAINVTHIPDVKMGDEVVLLGKQGNETITAELVAKWLDTINYEVVTSILARVPRR